MEFELTDLFTLIGIAIVAVLVVLNRNGNDTITVEGITEGIEVAGTVWADAQEFVIAAEQLYNTGKVDKESRFGWVLGRLKEQYPDLDTGFLVAAIEAGVYHLREWQGKA